MSDTVKTILAILGSGAFIGFVQFLINRWDSKHDRIQKLETEMHEGLDARERTGKARYDEHKEAIQEMRDAMIKLAKTAEDQHSYSECMGQVLVGLTQDKIVHLTKQYTERGAITLEELAILEALYRPYHDGLGGNGRGKAGYEHCQKLPVISEEKARELDKQSRAQNVK